MIEFLKKNIVWITIILVLLSFLAKSCHNENIIKNDSVVYKTVNTKKEAVDEMQVPDTVVKTFTKIKTITKFVEKIKVDTIKITYKDTIESYFEINGGIDTKEYSFDYKSTEKGLKLYNVNFNDSITLITGTKRKWFLGKQTNTIDIIHSNKYVNSGEVKHIEVQPKKKFYETTLFKIAVGFGAGVIIAK